MYVDYKSVLSVLSACSKDGKDIEEKSHVVFNESPTNKKIRQTALLGSRTGRRLLIAVISCKQFRGLINCITILV